MAGTIENVARNFIEKILIYPNCDTGIRKQPIARIQADGGTAAVDVTPGRKFMSAIAFQAEIQLNADHVFYLYVSNNRFYGRLYPDVPRPVVELIDFQEVF